MQPGDTVWIDQAAIPPHLWIVLSNPYEDGNLGESVLAASVTTARDTSREDHSCILNSGDHPDLEHRSWVYYGNTKPWGIAYLTKWGRASSPLCEAVLIRVLEGAARSDRIKLDYHAILDEQGLLPE